SRTFRSLQRLAADAGHVEGAALRNRADDGRAAAHSTGDVWKTAERDGDDSSRAAIHHWRYRRARVCDSARCSGSDWAHLQSKWSEIRAGDGFGVFAGAGESAFARRGLPGARIKSRFGYVEGGAIPVGGEATSAFAYWTSFEFGRRRVFGGSRWVRWARE